MTLPPRTEEIASEIVDAVFHVHSSLGPGLLESVYEKCLAYELSERNLEHARQVVMPISYKNRRIDTGLRLDFVVEGEIVIEVKAVETLVPVRASQLLTYLKLGGYRIGFLVNFNVALIKHGIHRYVL